MFGGYGLFLDELMFALIADNSLYFKADDKSVADFTAKDLNPFSYQRNGKTFSMSYYQAPGESLDDVDELCDWANKAYGAALRSAAKKSRLKL
jgi:DNA transformation protein